MPLRRALSARVTPGVERPGGKDRYDSAFAAGRVPRDYAEPTPPWSAGRGRSGRGGVSGVTGGQVKFGFRHAILKGLALLHASLLLLED